MMTVANAILIQDVHGVLILDFLPAKPLHSVMLHIN